MLKSSAKSSAFFLLVMSTVVVHANGEESVHEILSQFGLPKGLVPDSVNDYSLSEDGSFKIELQRPCYVQFDDLVYYDKEIRGKISYGKITDLSGIQAKKLFIWVSVTGIEMDSDDYILFQVGFISEKLPAKQFESIPTCKKNAREENNQEHFSLAEA